MRHKLNYIIEELSTVFDGKPWYGNAVLKILNDIDWRIVNDTKYTDKSIAVLLKHMVNWRVFVIKKLQGNETYDIIIDEANDWTKLSVHNEEEWLQLLKEIVNSQEQLLNILATHDDQILLKKVPGKDYDFGSILPSIAQHDLYHLGQLAMLNVTYKS